MSRAWIIAAAVLTLLAVAWLAGKYFGFGIALHVEPAGGYSRVGLGGLPSVNRRIGSAAEMIAFAAFAAVGLTVLYMTLGRRKR